MENELSLEPVANPGEPQSAFGDSNSLVSISEQVKINESQLRSKNKVLDEMLLSKKIPNENAENQNQVDERIYKDLAANKGDSFANSNTESIIKRKIVQYRELSKNPELEDIIRDIVNEAIITDTYDKYPVKLQINTDDIISKTIQKRTIDKIYKLFENILDKLNFEIEGPDLFTRWFIDGRLYLWRKKSETSKSNIAISYEVLDPLFLSLVVDTKGEVPPFYKYFDTNNVPVLAEGYNYFGMQSGGFGNNNGYDSMISEENTYEIPYEDVIVVFSGLYDYLLKIFISPIEKVMKVLNQLNNLEDAMVLYQFIRAVPRRVFKIDTGTLPPKEREAYLNQIQKRHRESLSLKYDTQTGEIQGDDKVRFLSLFDDYWIATNETDKTDISPLDTNAQEWDTITDKLNYFRRKLYRTMNVPFSRYESQQSEQGEFKMAADTLQRHERKFLKYIAERRKLFSELFYQILEKEVLDNSLLTKLEWGLLKKRVSIVWEDDSYFSQFKKYDILQKQVDIITNIEPMIGKFFTIDYVHKEILGRNDQEIDEVKAQLLSERPEFERLFGEGTAMGQAGSGAPGGGGESAAPSFENVNFGGEPGAETPEATAPETPEATAPETPAPEQPEL